MYRPNPKFRKQLNDNQIQTLVCLYKYRFASNELLATHLRKKDMYRQLRILDDQGLIGKRYDSSYKLLGKPAAYYLTAKGVRALESANVLKDLKVKYAYKTRTISEQFIARSLDILAISNQFHRASTKEVKFFTKVDLDKDDYDYFPNPLPDAYVRLINDEAHQQFFLDFFQESQPFFVVARRLQVYQDYYNVGYWDDTGTDFPVILVVLEDLRMQKKLTKYVATNTEGLHIYFARKADLLSRDNESRVWHDCFDSDSIRILEQLESPEAT